ncbi:VanZ family protein [Afipia sp. TerB]
MLAAAALMGVFLLSVVPAAERPVTGVGSNIEHFLCFALVGGMTALAFRLTLKTLLPAALLFTLILELAQIPLPTRHARFGDFVVDALSACAGILVARLLAWLMRSADRVPD